MHPTPAVHDASPERDRRVRRVLLLEGAANLVVLVAKLVVGLSTGSLAVLGDALHSLTDVANNCVALLVMRIAGRPPDGDHPYGHRKFETLAVFGLAGLLTVMAFELGLRAVLRGPREVLASPWGLTTMLVVLAIQVAIATWETRQARLLDSEILRADARHTLSDVLTTLAVLAGWQLAAAGRPWMDSLCALLVALIVLGLAYGLFKRSIPILVDARAPEHEQFGRALAALPGVEAVRRVRSRLTGRSSVVDVVVSVDAGLSTADGHHIASEIERVLRERFGVDDATVHVEPHQPAPPPKP